MHILSCKSNWVRTKFSDIFTSLNLASIKLLAAVICDLLKLFIAIWNHFSEQGFSITEYMGI